ncbi:MAG: phage major capsid protein [Clostridia bacterium]
MVSITTAEQALKSVYLGVIAEQLNIGVNPFLAKIEQTNSDVWGKEIIKLVSYGINGGIGAGSETGNLPTAAGNNYAQLKAQLKNLYGTLEISDKAMRASQNSSGAFVNLLNAEMEGLLKASKFNLGRMLYGDGTGKLANVVASSDTDLSNITLDSVNRVVEGMLIDTFDVSGNCVANLRGRRIVAVDRENKVIRISGTNTRKPAANDYITVQNSSDYEITGLEAIFSADDIYGLSRATNYWLKPTIKAVTTFDMTTMHSIIDKLDFNAGSNIDMILASYASKYKYLNLLDVSRTNVDYMTLDGGYKTLSFNGVPFVVDRFINEGDMYFLNTNDFKLHQLCDWRWIEGDGNKIIHQKSNTATYSATLVKYAEMICSKPIGQAKLTGVK